MFKRVLVFLLILNADVAYAVRGGVDSARPEVQAEAQAARSSQLQAQSPAPASPGPETGLTATGKPSKPAPYVFPTGPYIGLSIGKRMNHNGAPSVYTAAEAILSAGTGTLFKNKWYIGAEIFVDGNAQLDNYKNPNSVKSTWSYGIDVTPGLRWNDCLLMYLRGGIVSTNYHLPDGSTVAWRLGIGWETHLQGRWGLRADYIYSAYRRYDSVGRIQTAQYNLGLVYKFI